MDEVYLLWFLSISMLVCSFLSGLVPMAFRLSDNKSRLLALLGAGILVGTALSIIIPEGIDSLYAQTTQIIPLSAIKTIPTSSDAPNKSDNGINTATKSTKTVSHSEEKHMLPEHSKQNMTWIVGMSLIVGFVLMLLIEQFSVYQSAAGHQHLPDVITTNHSQTEYTLACQDDDTDIGLEEDDKTIIDETSSETKPIKDMNNTHKITMRALPDTPNNHIAGNLISANRYYDHSKHISVHKTRAAKVTPTLGLVIHAAADGIALGAAATTSHRDVEMIIFLAIMLHKAPAAFSLVVLLLHNGLRPPTIRRHLLAFSLSAPIAAILTYYGLSQSGKEVLRRNNATGIAMLFSAGTFLFVATVHVLPELIQNKLLTPKEMFFLLGGAFLPMLLTQII